MTREAAAVGRATWMLDGVGQFHHSRWGKRTIQRTPMVIVVNRPRFGCDSQARRLQLHRYQLNDTVRAGYSADSISL